MKDKFFVGILLLFSLAVEAGEYASFKYDKVNLRTGPGERFPILWVYQEKNFPVELIDSFETWRQVREKDGTVGWVHQNMLKKTRYAIVEQESSLLKKAEEEAPTVAVVQPGVIAKVEECPKGGYCKITVADENHTKKGWFPRSFLWGLDKGEVVEK
ncbi:MAG: SH3 domain-containing protein [Alphaproteobacteria bacterium]